MTEPDLRPPRQNGSSYGGLAIVLVLALAVGGYLGWMAKERDTPSSPTATPASTTANTDTAPIPSIAAAPAQEPPALPALPEPAEPAALIPLDTPPTGEPQHPVAADATTLDAGDVPGAEQAVQEWLQGRGQSFVSLISLPHHIVATIDNLARSHAAPRLWPLHPVGGRMAVQETPEGLVIAPDNSTRYDALVRFVVSIDPAQAASLYRRIYPVLQAAYENLGYPGRNFNDRLVAVIDHLLQTPEPSEPIRLHLVQVQGELAPQRPWLRYEYADPRWQSLSAGQKILVRIGPAHRQRIQRYLQQVRAQVVRP